MNLKDLRAKYGLTQQELSDLLGIPKRTIGNWEDGKRNLKDYMFNLIEFKVEAVMNKKYELYKELMEHCNHYDLSHEDYRHLEDIDYLTENVGRDGNTYYYYLDENYCAAINVVTGEIIDDDETIEELFC